MSVIRKQGKNSSGSACPTKSPMDQPNFIQIFTAIFCCKIFWIRTEIHRIQDNFLSGLTFLDLFGDGYFSELIWADDWHRGVQVTFNLRAREILTLRSKYYYEMWVMTAGVCPGFFNHVSKFLANFTRLRCLDLGCLWEYSGWYHHR